MAHYPLFLPGIRFAYLTTPEEQLAEALHPVGNLVAFDRPGEALPRPGAAPLYASHAEWQEAVTNQMRAARLVILRGGSCFKPDVGTGTGGHD